MRGYNPADAHIPLILENLVRVHLVTGELQSAANAAEQCCQSIRNHGPEPKHLALACNNLAVVHRRCQNFSGAARAFDEAMDSVSRLTGDDAQTVEAIIKFNRGVLLADQQKWVESEQDFRLSLRIHERQLGAEHPIIGDLSNNLGVVAYHAGHYELADTFLRRSMEVWESTLGTTAPRIATGRFNLAAVYRRKQRFAEAEWEFQRGLRVDKRNELSQMMGEPFFSNALDQPRPSWRPWLGPEIGLLNPVTLYESPLTIDVPGPSEELSAYRKQVDMLRADENSDALRSTLEKLGPWYHNLELRRGLMTNPEMGNHPAGRWQIIEPFVPDDLSGKSVLDIGCNAGYFSLQMKRRGAGRVVGVDIMPKVLAQARFVSNWEGLPVEFREMDTYEIECLGSFDYVVFVGVLYHLKHQLYALEKVANVCKDTLFFQSVVQGPSGEFSPKDDYRSSETEIFDSPEFPKLYFIEKSFNGDVSNWWFATQSCLTAMLRSVGFREIIPTAGPDTFVCRK